MHLLNVTTLKLETFLDENNRPPYTILSHTWLPDREEVSYQDLETYHKALRHEQTAQADSISSRKGFKKIQGCCNIASQCHNLEWAWVDTCCINKESSTELSEAINSMFKWYETAAICIVFLQDVQGVRQDIQQDTQNSDNSEDPGNDRFHFRDSKWFTRGWTLQELLAPQQHLLFYNSQWQFIGDMKEDPQLCDIVSEITSIPVAFLTGAPLHEACVAKRMSWASRRKTTRVEDIAYSLLGIFGVSMALLYGEGNRAFIRLQEEIINQTHDHSILAWGELLSKHENPFADRDDSEYLKEVGALAASPVDFKDCWDFERASEFLRYNDNLDFQVTTAGIQLGVNISISRPNGLHLCELSCFSWRVPDCCLCIMARKGPLMEHGTQRASAILPQYVRAGRILTTKFGIFTRLRRGHTIKLAKSAMHSNTVRSIERHNQDAGVILVDLPSGFGLETSYISPNFDFEVRPDKHKLRQNSIRIVYSNGADNTYPIPLLMRLSITVLAGIALTGLLGAVLVVGGAPVNIVIFSGIIEYSLFLWTFNPGIWLLVWRLLHIEIGRSTINRDIVRACLRITEPSQRTPAGDDKALMLILCFRPRWIEKLNAERNHIQILRKATLECYLSPVLTGDDVESNHPTGLNSRITVYREWHNSRGDMFYMSNIKEFSSTTHDKSPSLYVCLSKETNSNEHPNQRLNLPFSIYGARLINLMEKWDIYIKSSPLSRNY
ncbi:heterokaryon incompatibility protein-domain-containing protein [Xylaria scruposa]|nr:heterokaryon incompatibility protein-domain-containing protein [Xylaria scruposa]